MALHYFLMNHPTTSAEVYNIEGGDHVLLVIGRKEGSDPSKPETWGENAYICDPWSNKVYPATDYLKETKNFYRINQENGNYTNFIEDFDPSRHQFSPVPTQNNLYILDTTSKSREIVLNVFKRLAGKYISIYEKQASDLEKIGEHLKTEYGEDHPKYKLIEQKVKNIKKITVEMRQDFNESNTKEYTSYKQLENKLTKNMKERLNTLKSTGYLSKEEYSQLNSYQNKDSLKTRIMEFLQIRSKTIRDYESAIKETENGLEGKMRFR